MSQALAQPHLRAGQPTQRPFVPPLVSGDRLSMQEYERRYNAMPGVKNAQLIEGVVYMPSPVRYSLHGAPHSKLNFLLFYYAAKTPGLPSPSDNTTVRLDPDNEPQPDVLLLLPSHVGGRAKIDDEDYVSGPPALVCEIAASTVSIDLHLKKTAYRRNGVQEYLVWRTEDQAIDWFELSDGEYAPIAPQPDGSIRSRAFPGLWINPTHLIAGDLAASLGVLDQGIASPEHADFVQRLKSS
jgi:hypothetical protein